MKFFFAAPSFLTESETGCTQVFMWSNSVVCYTAHAIRFLSGKISLNTAVNTEGFSASLASVVFSHVSLHMILKSLGRTEDISSLPTLIAPPLIYDTHLVCIHPQMWCEHWEQVNTEDISTLLRSTWFYSTRVNFVQKRIYSVAGFFSHWLSPLCSHNLSTICCLDFSWIVAIVFDVLVFLYFFFSNNI